VSEVKDKRILMMIRVPSEVKRAVKVFAASNNIMMSEVYDDATEWFLDGVASGEYKYFYATSKLDSGSSLWLKPEVANRARLVAEETGHSAARVILTGLILYMEKQEGL